MQYIQEGETQATVSLCKSEQSRGYVFSGCQSRRFALLGQRGPIRIGQVDVIHANAWGIALPARCNLRLVTVDAPSEEEDPTWDPADTRHSVIRWLAQPIGNAMGPTFTTRARARFCYVTQPGDGVTNLIPKQGPYDEFAINWGYRPIAGATAPQDELATLDEWASKSRISVDCSSTIGLSK